MKRCGSSASKVMLALCVAAPLLVAVTAVAEPLPLASSAEPKVPPGVDPGGVPVALITTGLDYTDPAISAHLARDGEGELIGWDLTDDDRKPFAPAPNPAAPVAEQGGDGTVLAKALLAFNDGETPNKRMSLIVFKVNAADKAMIGKAAAYASKTPAKTVIIPMTGGTADDWQLFKEAALVASHVRFVVPDCGIDGEPMMAKTYPAAWKLQNMVIVGKNATLDGPYAAVVKAVCGF